MANLSGKPPLTNGTFVGDGDTSRSAHTAHTSRYQQRYVATGRCRVMVRGDTVCAVSLTMFE
jgi:hypothetical protein